MEQFAAQLNASRAVSLSDVRVLRYEYFQRPALVCRAIFDFVFSSEDGEVQDKVGLEDVFARVCDKHFPSGQFAATSAAGGKFSQRRPGMNARRFPPRRLEQQEEQEEKRRQLRLHTPDESVNPYAELTFRPDSIRRSVTERLEDYFTLYRHNAVTGAQRLKLDQLDHRLLRFGYSVGYTQPSALKGRGGGTVLDDFDLIIRFTRKKSRRASQGTTNL
jgi:hypothetical protein